MTADIPDRTKASTMWWLQGDEFVSEGNIDYAMRRYNQSWLLDPNNYQPYWNKQDTHTLKKQKPTSPPFKKKSTNAKRQN